MKNLVEVLRKKCPDYDSTHGLVVCDILNQRIMNPLRDIERGKIEKDNVIKILQVVFENNFIEQKFFVDSMRKIDNVGRPLQVTR